jgi:hypothetical protein
VPEVVPIASSARIGDLLGLIARRFGDRPAHLEGRRLSGQGGFAPTRFLPVAALSDRPAESLSVLGIRSGDGVRVRCGEESFFAIAGS